MRFFLLICICVLFSCSKKDNNNPTESCYVCTHATTITTANSVDSKSNTTTACGLTPDEVKNLETAGTSTTVSGGTTTKVVTTCQKQ